MKRTVSIILIGVATMLALDAYTDTNHNAVLICGTTVQAGKSSEHLWWDGGRDGPETGRNEFWNDLYLMWEILYATSRCSLYIPPETPEDLKHTYDHIWVLYGDGNEYMSDWRAYRAEQYRLERITDCDASLSTLTWIFLHLSGEMTNQDNLFVYKGRGNYDVIWDGKDRWGNSVGSGVYFCRLVGQDFRITRKMVILE